MDQLSDSRSEFKKQRLDTALRRKKLRIIYWLAAVCLIIGGIAFGFSYFTKQSLQNLPGLSVPDQGREHVVGTNHPPYNSNPPVSGWHDSSPAEWGVYKEELPDEVLIHNLEHGGIWISYKPGISPELVEKLENFYKEWGRKTIVTPRAANDTDVTLAAWTRLDKFNSSEYSEERVEKFIKAFRNKGPEFVP